MKIFLTNKKVFSVANGAEQFLNGLTSNTLDVPNNAFLDIHGKIVATFDQLKVVDDQYFILVEEPYTKPLQEHVDKYLKLSKTTFELQNYQVYFDLEGIYKLQDGEYGVQQKQGQLVITTETLETNVSDDEFTLFRLKNDIPLHGVDYQDEMLLNVSTEEFVSFTKGCFLGQEPISKVYNRSKPTWKLVVRAQDEIGDDVRGEMTSKTVDPESQKTLGFAFIRND